jgi:hypothetical protein
MEFLSRLGQRLHCFARFSAGPCLAPFEVCTPIESTPRNVIDPFSRRVAASLSPEDPEIAFNLAAVLEASRVHEVAVYCLLFTAKQ